MYGLCLVIPVKFSKRWRPMGLPTLLLTWLIAMARHMTAVHGHSALLFIRPAAQLVVGHVVALRIYIWGVPSIGCPIDRVFPI